MRYFLQLRSFLPILKFDPVEQIFVQFIFRSIIGIEALLSKF